MMNILKRVLKVIVVVLLAPFTIAADVASSIWTLYEGLFNIIRGK